MYKFLILPILLLFTCGSPQFSSAQSPILPIKVADGTPVRQGFLSPYKRSVRAPLRSMGRVYLRESGRSRRAHRGSQRVLGGWGGPGFIGRATFRPQGLF